MELRLALGWMLSLALAGPVQAAALANTVDGVKAAPGSAGVADAGISRLPLAFEPNQGQSDPDVAFLARGPRHAFFATPGGVLFNLHGGANARAEPPAVIRLSFAGGRTDPEITGEDALAARSHYFLGATAHEWRTDVPNYRRIRYHEVYPGIDVVLYGNQRDLEYDFILAPGADPDAIGLDFKGADRLHLDAEGQLRIETARGGFVQRRPVAYQEIEGRRVPVASEYRVRPDGHIGFTLGPYDRSRALVIDPVFQYIALFGGGGFFDGMDYATSVAVDGNGNILVAGITSSSSFPVRNARQPAFGGGSQFFPTDVFVLKINAAGDDLLYSTYLGGSGDETSEAAPGADEVDLALDASGNAYLTGTTKSPNFPTASAFQATLKGPSDAFVAKLSSSGSLLLGTYLGGSQGFDGQERGDGIALDGNGAMHVVVASGSGDFPQQGPGGIGGMFLVKFQSSGSAIAYVHALNTDFGDPMAVAVDGSGRAVVAGTGRAFNGNGAVLPTGTDGRSCSTAGGPQSPAWVMRIKADGTTMEQRVLICGSSAKYIGDIVLDGEDNAYVIGTTSATDLTTLAAFQPAAGGGNDAFVAKVTAGGTLAFSSYLGGAGDDNGNDIAVAADGSLLLTGAGGSGFPGATSCIGLQRAPFLVHLVEINDALEPDIHDCIGAEGESFGVASTPSGHAVMVGLASVSFPPFPTFGSLQQGFGPGTTEAFVAKLDLADSTPPSISVDDAVPVIEGDLGDDNKVMVFRLRLSKPVLRAVAVNVTTGPALGTANANDWINPPPQTVVFWAGQTVLEWPVEILGDFHSEPTETVRVQLSLPDGATIADGEAFGDILNDDALAYADEERLLEGDGDHPATVDIRLRHVSVRAARVSVSTALTGSFAPHADSSDFTGPTTVVTLPANSMSAPYTLTLHGDLASEGDETFKVVLAPGGDLWVSIEDPEAVQTIVDDDGLRLSADDIVQAEGSSGARTVTCEFELSGFGPAGGISFDVATVDGSARASEDDYVAIPTTRLTIPEGGTSVQVPVTVGGDLLREPNELFVVEASNIVGAQLADAQCIVNLVNDDLPILSVVDFSAFEGDAGTTLVNFQACLDSDATQDVSLTVGINHLATTPTDIVPPASGPYTIPAGSRCATITMGYVGDLLLEPNESFGIVIGDLVGATLGAIGQGTILNDDVPFPDASITGGSVVEGNDGVRLAAFEIRLSAPSTKNILLKWSTLDGTATAGQDYGAVPPTLVSLLPGTTSATVTAFVQGDSEPEANEVFKAILTEPVGANVVGDPAEMTIINDDLPRLTVADASIVEGNAGTQELRLTATLSQPAGAPVSFKFTTRNGSASSGSDYQAQAGTTVTMAAGVEATTFVVLVNGDTAIEDDETVLVDLGDPQGVTLARPTATGTILNDDTALSIADASVTEGNAGTTNANFTISLSRRSAAPVSFNISTSNGTASAGSDYDFRAQTGFSVPAGTTSRVFSVPVRGDRLVEPDETFTVNLTGVAGATLLDGIAIGTILNDDTTPLPAISISDASATEGNAGTTTLRFTVSLSAPAPTGGVSYSIATSDQTATAGSDYTARSLSGQVIPAGASSQFFDITVAGDTVMEPNETLRATVSSVVGAGVADAIGIGTIINDDNAPTPALTIVDASVSEGNAGEKLLSFPIQLSGPAPVGGVLFSISTSDGTATAGLDYVARSQAAAAIPAGLSSGSVTVSVLGDSLAEGNETFLVTVGNLTGATLADGQATGTILDDETAPIIVTVAGGGVGDGGPATAAHIGGAAALNLAGNDLLVAGFTSYRIRKISGGIAMTLAGTGLDGYAGDGAPATAARIGTSNGITSDTAGNIYFSDRQHHVIRRRDAATGNITTIAGTGVAGYNGDGIAATSAQLNFPYAIALGPDGALYFADGSNQRIRRISAGGVITTVAGTGASGLGADGIAATASTLAGPFGIAFDAAGHLYFSEFANHRIRRVDRVTGLISTVTGTGTAGFTGDGAAATLAQLSQPLGLRFDATGALFVADRNNFRVRRIQGGIISTVAGNGSSTGAIEDLPALQASLGAPFDVQPTPAGELLIADAGNDQVFKMDTGGILRHVSGRRLFGGDGGPATEARLFVPWGIAPANDGSFYFTDRENARLRFVGQDGVIITLAGTGTHGFNGDGEAATRQLNRARGLALAGNGDLYIADSDNHRIRKLVGDRIVTVAGDGVAGFGGDGGPALAARLNRPNALALDHARNLLYVSDHGNSRIRRIDLSTGSIQPVAGTGTAGFNGDGLAGSATQFSGVFGLAVENDGNLLFSDQTNARLRRWNRSSQLVSTVAGTGTAGYAGDGGLATSAQIRFPFGVAVDSQGNIYLADDGNARIRKILPSGVISTHAGNGASGYAGDGRPATLANLESPWGVAADPAGYVYYADSAQDRIRKIGSFTVPGAATGVLAVAGNGQATVTFQPPADDGGTTITGYIVESSPAGGVDLASGSTALQRTLTGLVNGQAYTFTARAINVVGTGPASAASASITPLGDIPPLASMLDASVMEGDSGSRNLVFTVQLDRAAPAGGSRFDISTATGRALATAQAGTDYAATSRTGLLIPAGQSSASFSVKVFGDTVRETDETLIVTLSNPVNARLGQAEGTGRIINDDQAGLASTPDAAPIASGTALAPGSGTLTSISSLQGTGRLSPMLGRTVQVEGIVTALLREGVFLQSPRAAEDGDPASSEGLFLRLDGHLLAGLRVADLVRATGTVRETMVGADERQYTRTQLDATQADILVRGQPLPAATDLDARQLNPRMTLDFLERHEGMRVRVPSLRVSSPVGGRIDPASGLALIDGVFHGVADGVARPRAEPGQHPLSPAAGAFLADGNPERLRIDSAAQSGARALAVDAGDLVQGLVGVLDYREGLYALLPDPQASIRVQGGAAPVAAPQRNPGAARLAYLPLQGLYDDRDDPARNEPISTPSAYARRMAKTARAICDYLQGPDLLVLTGIEGGDVLAELADAVVTYSSTAPPGSGCSGKTRYRAIGLEGRDADGLGQGLLLVESTGQATPRFSLMPGSTLAGNPAHPDSAGNGSPLFDLPPRWLRLRLEGVGGRSLPVSLVLAQFSADRDDSSASGRRLAQARALRTWLQGLRRSAPDDRLLVLGGFEAAAFDAGEGDPLAIVTHRDATGALFNLERGLPPAERYSSTRAGETIALDHALADASLLREPGLRLEWARLNADFGLDHHDDAALPMRFTERDVMLIHFGQP